MEKLHINEIILGGEAENCTELAPSQEDLSLKTKELLFATLHLGRLKGRKRDAETETARLLCELQIANSEAKELALKFEESNAKSMAYKLKVQLLGNSGSNHYREVISELEDVKAQLTNLQLDMAAVSEIKARAEKEVEANSTKASLHSGCVDKIKEEMEEASVEEALINLAADREFREIEAQRKAAVVRFCRSTETIKNSINDLHQELDCAKKLQMELAVTVSDVNVLRNEIELIRLMDKNTGSKCLESSLESAESELEAAKKELFRLKEGGFQLMAEMDAVREALQQIADEKEQSSSRNKKSDSSLAHLNHKLHKAMSKLEDGSMAEKRTEAIVSNVSAALQQLQTDIGAARRDTHRFNQETRAIRMEIEKTKGHNVSMEEWLEAAMKELKAVKASETVALEKLRTINAESTMSDRTISSLYNSSVTTSKFEYFYLIKQAKAAQETADRKMAVEDKNRYISGRAAKTKHNAAETDKKKVQSLNLKLATAVPRRSVTVSGVSDAARRAKTRRRSSGRQPRIVSSTTWLAYRGRKKTLLNLAKFLRGSK